MRLLLRIEHSRSARAVIAIDVNWAMRMKKSLISCWP